MVGSEAEIVVIGSLNVDLVVRTNRVPRAGETLMGNSFARFPGGKGANQAVAAARLGGNVHMIGRVGADLFGTEQLRGLQEYGVCTDAVVCDRNATTGVAIITVEESTGQNRILIVPGANGECSPADVEKQHTLISSARAVVCQLEVPLSVVMYAATLAKQSDSLFVLNPAPATELPPELLAKTDVITPNETEAERLTGIAVQSPVDAQRAAARLQAIGVASVVITLGKQGVYGVGAAGEFFVAAHQVQAVDTVAAGDCFTGALTVALAEGKTLQEAAVFANAAAAISVTRNGAQPSMPSRDEVLQLLK